MEIPLYLAMTAAEVQCTEVLPSPVAWMACHFSSYGTGLSNVPKALPPGSMLMLNDRTPICGHNPDLVAQTICNTAKALGCDRILLDFQRQDCWELFEVVRAVLEMASCPVGVSSLYAADFNCAVLVPPIMPHVLPEKALSLWKGRELWLEISTEGTEIKVAADGSAYAPLPYFPFDGIVHAEPELHCHYRIITKEDHVLFHLGRTEDDQKSLLETVKRLGVTCALGLWQEIRR